MKPITAPKARIHAHICGDGSAFVKNDRYSAKQMARHPRRNIFEKVWMMEYNNMCPELLQEFRTDLLEAYKRKAYYHKKESKMQVQSVKWILQELELVGKDSYNWYVSKAVMRASKPAIIAWIRAFFDDESTVDLSRRVIRVKSMNSNGLRQVATLLRKLNIDSNITGPNCDKSYYLNVRNKAAIRYIGLISSNHPEKRKKMEKWPRRDFHPCGI